MRRENSIDFWRGYALVCIFINHVPGIRAEHITLRAFSIADSAEMFVFFAGCAVNIATRDSKLPLKHIFERFWLRCLDIYRAHLIISLSAIILLVEGSAYLQRSEIINWMRLRPLILNPLEGITGVVTLSYQLQFFDILPLYVFLLLFSPIMIWLHRYSQIALISLSFLIYSIITFTHFNLRQTPGGDGWFFNPLAWQFIFVLGFVCTGRADKGAKARKLPRILWPVSLAVVLAAFGLHLFHAAPDPVITEGSLAASLFNKTFLGPARLVQFAALVIVFRHSYGFLQRTVPFITGPGCLLGRNSLPVFCAGSILSLLGQFARLETGGSPATDVTICLVGIALLLLTAKVSEWKRVQYRLPPPSSPCLSPE